jgi:hypothetical protein
MSSHRAITVTGSSLFRSGLEPRTVEVLPKKLLDALLT